MGPCARPGAACTASKRVNVDGGVALSHDALLAEEGHALGARHGGGGLHGGGDGLWVIAHASALGQQIGGGEGGDGRLLRRGVCIVHAGFGAAFDGAEREATGKRDGDAGDGGNAARAPVVGGHADGDGMGAIWRHVGAGGLGRGGEGGGGGGDEDGKEGGGAAEGAGGGRRWVLGDGGGTGQSGSACCARVQMARRARDGGVATFWRVHRAALIGVACGVTARAARARVRGLRAGAAALCGERARVAEAARERAARRADGRAIRTVGGAASRAHAVQLHCQRRARVREEGAGACKRAHVHPHGERAQQAAASTAAAAKAAAAGRGRDKPHAARGAAGRAASRGAGARGGVAVHGGRHGLAAATPAVVARAGGAWRRVDAFRAAGAAACAAGAAGRCATRRAAAARRATTAAPMGRGRQGEGAAECVSRRGGVRT
ncbi:extensin [Gracilaria domingensis]|nr:extensin [Gracilaria domingensis]